MAAGVAVRATRSFTEAELCEMDAPGSTTRSLIWMWLALMPSVALTKPSIVVAKAYVPSERYEAACDTCTATLCMVSHPRGAHTYVNLLETRERVPSCVQRIYNVNVCIVACTWLGKEQCTLTWTSSTASSLHAVDWPSHTPHSSTSPLWQQ